MFFLGKPCVPLIASNDLIFKKHNIVQTDLLVICYLAMITEANIQGAPDFLIEVFSPSTSLRDKREKRAIFEHFGVCEDLSFHPGDEFMERYWLEGSRNLEGDILNWDETHILAAIFPDLALNLLGIFGKEPIQQKSGIPYDSPGAKFDIYHSFLHLCLHLRRCGWLFPECLHLPAAA
jgi:hypothetical protein